jgi:hypothetical protein
VLAAKNSCALEELARGQGGVVTRAQARASGLSKAQVESNLTSGRWRRVFKGVYATFTGPVPRHSLLWAVVLKAGPGAVLSHETAAELWGLAERASTIHVSVPAERTPARIPGVVVHRSQRALRGRHPARTPPQTRLEDTVVDLTQTSRRADDAIAWLARAVGARLTTAERLSAELGRRPKLRWRGVLRAALEDVAAGCHSLTEVKYRRDVERAHGLPTADRQVRHDGVHGSRYDDVRYRMFRTRVELDGRAAHPGHERWRDMRRDNVAMVEGDRVLRYGLADVGAYPCHIAAQVALVLQAAGWEGRPRRCHRSDCVVGDDGLGFGSYDS